MARQTDRDETYDLLNQYLQEIARIPRLTPERERELGYRVQQNDKSALEELVKANLRFVVSYAKRFRNAHVLFLDLINEGNIGLIQAAKKFDPDKNVKFITYAVWWIRQAILHALSEQGGAFRLPPKRANLLYRLEKMIGTIITEENRIPTAEDLAEKLNVPLKDVQTLLQSATDSFSLNSELDSESHMELGDVIEQTMVRSAEDEMEEQSRRIEILAQMAHLTMKERLILSLRHGVTDNLPKTLAEIGELLNRQPADIGEVVQRATRQLCEQLCILESELAQLLLFTNPRADAWDLFWALPDLPDDLDHAVPLDRMGFLDNLKKQGGIQQALSKLTLEERTLLQLRYGVLQDEELTLRDIGELLQLSRERVRQIEARAEAKCRRLVKRA